MTKRHVPVCPSCGEPIAISIDPVRGTVAWSCECGGETIPMADVFDDYMRDTWDEARWWVSLFSRIVTPSRIRDALAGMPEYPRNETDDEDTVADAIFCEEVMGGDCDEAWWYVNGESD